MAEDWLVRTILSWMNKLIYYKWYDFLDKVTIFVCGLIFFIGAMNTICRSQTVGTSGQSWWQMRCRSLSLYLGTTITTHNMCTARSTLRFLYCSIIVINWDTTSDRLKILYGIMLRCCELKKPKMSKETDWETATGRRATLYHTLKYYQPLRKTREMLWKLIVMELTSNIGT